jgi:hypothetical protein
VGSRAPGTLTIVMTIEGITQELSVTSGGAQTGADAAANLNAIRRQPELAVFRPRHRRATPSPRSILHAGALLIAVGNVGLPEKCERELSAGRDCGRRAMR